MTKICPRCKIEKDLSEFPKHKNSEKPRSYCRVCELERSREWSAKYPERKKDSSQKYFERNKDRLITQKQKDRNSNKNNIRIKERLSRYRKFFALSDFENLLVIQENECAICKTSFGDISKPYALFIDHDHQTSIVRGLLCKNCNYGLGNFFDNPDLLFRAIQYLRKFQQEDYAI